MNFDYVTIKVKIFKAIEWATNDILNFGIVMGCLILIGFLVMKPALNFDDKVWMMISTIFLTCGFFLMLVMASNGTIELFIAKVIAML
ncbi:hypothetical protein K8R33_02885 [archaeon]|nr:hypothetical protein [archaeon]